MKNKSIKQVKSLLIGSALFTVSNMAAAEVIVLDFEGVGNTASIDEFYNGGTDSLGNSGTDYDISFNTNTLGIVDSDAGGTGNFANEPSADTIMFFLTGSAVLNYSPGFDTGFSFFYSSSTAASVYVYDALNATGNLLATLNLTAQYADGCVGDPNGSFCNWTAVGASFTGTAMSIDFGGTVDQTGYDDITFGSATAGGDPTVDVSAPLGLGFMALGLGLVARTRQRNR
jgi:hypothetical protein